ncbi:MAG: PKD domain-containing protein [Thermoplasmatales archaeon]|nr:MAG: PKD domain-containing protein [Thermoplasmatales archaeon]
MKRIKGVSSTFLIIIFFLSTFAFLLPIENAKADTLHVGSGQTYTSIQSAINIANESDIIYVHSGTYSETIIINKSITLTGEGSSTTTISGSGDHTIKITSNNVSISGFKIQNTMGSYYCLYLDSISDCEISNNHVKNGGHGAYLRSSNNNYIIDNIIENNNVGIYFSNSDINSIQSNNIKSNNANGIFLNSQSSGNTIYLNDFSNNLDSNAKDYGSNNWDYNEEGNYWDDYDGVDDNNDNIGDTPYLIAGGSNQDNYPLGYFTGGNQAPTANANGPYSGQTSIEIEFDGSGSSDSDGSIIGYRWDWTNDGSYDTSWLSKSKTTHIYSSAGTYTVKLQVKDNFGATDTDISQVTIIHVNQKPKAYIIKPTIPEADYGDSINFEAHGSDSDGTIIEYLWWSDPEELHSVNKSFIKNDLPTGQYIIYLKVKDNSGEWSSEVSTTLKILSDEPDNQAPIADAAGPYIGYVNQSIIFDASGSYDPDSGDTISYFWDFGDGSTSEDMFPSHIYSSEGNYTVQLTVIDNHGAQSKSSASVNISQKENEDKKESNGISGFETIILIIAVAILVLIKRKRN